MKEERKREREKRGKDEKKCINEKRKKQGKKDKRKKEIRIGKKGARGKSVSFSNEDGKLIFWGGGGGTKNKRWAGKMKRSFLMKGERSKEGRGKGRKK